MNQVERVIVNDKPASSRYLDWKRGRQDLSVLLLHSLVGVRLVLDEGPEDVLVLVGVVVLGGHLFMV